MVRDLERGGKMKKISVVIPVYNSANSIMKLYQRLTDTISLLTKHYEIIFINDGSSDNSKNVIKNIIQINNIHLIDLYKNYGK